MNTILVLHIFFCSFMTGVIWLVQILIYPNFKNVGNAEFEKFHDFHMNRITWVVGPVMVLELATGTWLLVKFQSSFFLWNFISILLLWFLTALVNVPTHKNLTYQNLLSKTNLVSKNWPRTIIWTFRLILWLYWLVEKVEKT